MDFEKKIAGIVPHTALSKTGKSLGVLADLSSYHHRTLPGGGSAVTKPRDRNFWPTAFELIIYATL